jgi:hypothetical protein
MIGDARKHVWTCPRCGKTEAYGSAVQLRTEQRAHRCGVKR